MNWFFSRTKNLQIDEKKEEEKEKNLQSKYLFRKLQIQPS
jgi:hypothetical protein